MRTGQTITALDIGTKKIIAIIAKVSKDRFLEIKGIGVGPSIGYENGVVKNMTELYKNVETVLEQAEIMAEISAKNIFLSFSGNHIISKNSVGQISISTTNSPAEITESHIENVKINAMNNVQLEIKDSKKEIVHVIPQEFEIDGRADITNPLKMTGFNLKAYVHVILADKIRIDDLKNCVALSGYNVEGIVCAPVASSYAVLNDVEKKLGSIMLDIGAGTTDIAVYLKNSLIHTAVLEAGGTNITNDLTIGLKTSPNEAEHIKKMVGNAMKNTIPPEKLVEIKGIGGREPRQKKVRYIGEIIEARMREILDVAYENIINNVDMTKISAGLTVTGGTSLLKNIEILSLEIFNKSTKIGYPDLQKLKGATDNLNDPAFATGIGILYYVYDLLEKNEIKAKTYVKKKGMVGFLNKIIKYISEIFTE